MDMYEVVSKLIGPISPVGETYTDSARFDNLEVLTKLVDRLIGDIDRISTDCKNMPEHSVSRAGKHCSDFLDALGIQE